MKLSQFKGIAHDFLNHLEFNVFWGHWKDFPSSVDRDLLGGSGALDREAFTFFEERLPKSFDVKRIQSIYLKAKRTPSTFSGTITIVVDDKSFSCSLNGMIA